MHKSIATINSPEFINLQPLDINPLMSSCEIKVLYLGENRNQSFITKEVATEMAKTLRGAPIVGYYKESDNDFADHGNRMIIDDEGIKFECLTIPYGFVSPDAKVWFQTFEDTDDFGNVETREYLMTTGYLWTGQFEECKLAIEQGRPQSMELDEESLNGHWETNKRNGMDFFIINDAVFSKLCILGDDVEPCFEGANVTAPNVSSSFTKMDDAFRKTLFTMMQELQFALKGGQQMDNEIVNPVVEEVVEENETIEETTVDNTESVVEPSAETAPEQNEEIVVDAEEAAPAEEFVAPKKDDEEDNGSEDGEEDSADDVNDDNSSEKEKEDEQEEESDGNSDDQEDDEEKNKKFELLQEQYSTLLSEYEELQVKYEELVSFKNQVEDAKKDEMINKFYFLSDSDKQDVIENKSKYTIEEIESKLSVISVRNKVNFNLDNNDKTDIKTEETPVMTYSLNVTGESVPAWVSAVKNNKQK